MQQALTEYLPSHKGQEIEIKTHTKHIILYIQETNIIKNYAKEGTLTLAGKSNLRVVRKDLLQDAD